jgi:Tfp pilus assembly protein PilO
MQLDRPIAIAIVLIITVLLIVFLVSPEYKTFNRLRMELGEKLAEYNAEFDYYAEVSKVYYELKNREEFLEKIDDALPENLDLGQIIYFLHKTSSENGLIIKDLFLSKSSKSDVSKNINDVIFSVDIMGDYSSLAGFLTSLEKSARIFEVTNISFGSDALSRMVSTENQLTANQIYIFNLQIKTHSYQ